MSNSNNKTLEQFVLEEVESNPLLDNDFISIINHLIVSSKIISSEVRRAGLNDILGLAEQTNVHGEDVKKLDLIANDIIIESVSRGDELCLMGSEENEEAILLPSQNKKGKYVLVFDPLDGSSNIDVNVTIGTIWGLYKRLDTASEGDGNIHDLLQSGDKQVAAGYVLFGPQTIFVFSSGQGVNIFTYDTRFGEFLLSAEDVQIPKKSSFYSVNEGNAMRFSKYLNEYLDFVKRESSGGDYPYKLRYIGSAVADFHRTLLYGGLFMYPMDKKNPNGKLRLLYEASPLAFLVEQAGGRATDGFQDILSIRPDTLHGRTPLFIGSSENVTEVEQFLLGKHTRQQE